MNHVKYYGYSSSADRKLAVCLVFEGVTYISWHSYHTGKNVNYPLSEAHFLVGKEIELTTLAWYFNIRTECLYLTYRPIQRRDLPLFCACI